VSPSILAEVDDGNTRPKLPETRGFVSIRRGRRWMVLVLLSAVPVVVAASSIQERLSVFISVGWLAAFLLVSSLHALALCPRCGHRCFILSPRLNPWATRCLHCRTRLYWSDAELDVTESASLGSLTKPR
jgi:hypothetical protein